MLSVYWSIQTALFPVQASTLATPISFPATTSRSCVETTRPNYDSILASHGYNGEKSDFLIDLDRDGISEIIVTARGRPCALSGNCPTSILGKVNKRWVSLYQVLSYAGSSYYTPTDTFSNGYQDLRVTGIYRNVLTQDPNKMYGRAEITLRFDGTSYQVVARRLTPIKLDG